MDDFQINMFAFFAVAEFTLVLLVVAAALVLRSRALAGRVEVLQRQLKQVQDVPEPVGYAQYLRDEIIRNAAFVEQAAAADDDAEPNAAQLLGMRKQFLELELAAHALDNNPVQFQATLAAGLGELIEQLRPAPASVAVAVAQEASDEASAAPPAAATAKAEAGRATRDTHDEEFNRLKQVINNQQDAMAALRGELKAREADIQDLDSILRKLDEFEQHDGELQQCLKVLEQENERLKRARSAGRQSSATTERMNPEQLNGLKSMLGNQQKTIANLENLIRELAPEASKAADLEAAINSIQRSNQELNSCVAVLEDENAMLRAELEAVNAQLDREEKARAALTEAPGVALAEPETAADSAADSGAAGIEGLSANEEKHQLEIKVQELEALVEFKDAAIEELEKQYNTLESKYLTLTGEK